MSYFRSRLFGFEATPLRYSRFGLGHYHTNSPQNLS